MFHFACFRICRVGRIEYNKIQFQPTLILIAMRVWVEPLLFVGFKENEVITRKPLQQWAFFRVNGVTPAKNKKYNFNQV